MTGLRPLGRLFVRSVNDGEDLRFPLSDAFDPVSEARIEVNAVTGLEQVGVVLQRNLHLTLKHEDEFLALM